jgi:hypothetical protein
MINQTEEWLYKKAKEFDSEIELEHLYTSKFMFGGSWVMELLEEYHKEQLNLCAVSHRREQLSPFCDNKEQMGCDCVNKCGNYPENM